MTFSKTEQELFDKWNSIKDDSDKRFERSEFKRELELLLEQEVREELSEEETETLTAYNNLFNYEVDYGFRCSYTLDCSEIEQEEECSKEDLIDYLKGDDMPEEPDAHDSVASGEVDIWVDYTGDIRPNINLTEFGLKEIYTNFTPLNAVAPIKETNKFKLVLEIEDNSSENDPSSYTTYVRDFLNFANNGYKVVTAKFEI